MKWLFKSLVAVLRALLVLALGLAAAGWWWVEHPLSLRGERAEVSIEPGTSPREIARLWAEAGVQAPAELLYQWFRISGLSKQIRAGSYEIETGASPRSLLERMVKGDQVLETLRLIEGWNLRQVRAAVAKAPNLRPTTQALSDDQLAAALGHSDGAVEGWFFPDTYVYSRGVSDLTVLKRAHAAMQQRLQQAWALKSSDVPLRSPGELLTLASVVEKETGQAADRTKIAGVFNNRLRIGMPLQSDPTVIYGLGERFDGNLRKVDLLTDHPWNTYTRKGLPATAIAMPGWAALRAAAQPEHTDALYFVARGDGSSAFSATLADHNHAVNIYQRGGR